MSIRARLFRVRGKRLGRCRHLSHRLHLPCLRGRMHQSLCPKHLATCLTWCPTIEGKRP
jgi:hypothetical protein